jgi:osmotically-inducible protein OsmY
MIPTKRIAFHARTLSLLGLGIASIAAFSATGCGQRPEEATGTDHPPVVERGAQGTEIEFHQQEAQRNLDQAGHDLGKGASELGQALAHGAREVGKEVAPVAKDAGRQLAEGAREVGQKIGPAARQAGQQLQQAGHEVGEKVGPALSDSSLTASVKAKLIADSSLHGIQIGVDTSAGEVTLSGKVSTPEQKAEAEKVAIQTQGVRRVVNNLQVGG